MNAEKEKMQEKEFDQGRIKDIKLKRQKQFMHKSMILHLENYWN